MKVKEEEGLIRFFRYSHPITSQGLMYISLFVLVLGFYAVTTVLDLIGFPLIFISDTPKLVWFFVIGMLLLMMFLIGVWNNRNWYNEGIIYHPHENSISKKNNSIQLSPNCSIDYEYYSKIRFGGKIKTATLSNNEVKIDLPVTSINEIEMLKQNLPTSLQSKFEGNELTNEIPKDAFNSYPFKSFTYDTYTKTIKFSEKNSFLNSIMSSISFFLFLNIAMGFVVGLLWLFDVAFEGTTSLSKESLTLSFGIPFLILMNLLLPFGWIIPELRKNTLSIYLNPEAREIGFFDHQFTLSYQAILQLKSFVYENKEYTDMRIKDRGKTIPLPFLENSDLVKELAVIMSKKLKIGVEGL